MCNIGLYTCPFFYIYFNTGTPIFLDLVLRKRREGVGDFSRDVKMYIWERWMLWINYSKSSEVKLNFNPCICAAVIGDNKPRSTKTSCPPAKDIHCSVHTKSEKVRLTCKNVINKVTSSTIRVPFFKKTRQQLHFSIGIVKSTFLIITIFTVQCSPRRHQNYHSYTGHFRTVC